MNRSSQQCLQGTAEQWCFSTINCPQPPYGLSCGVITKTLTRFEYAGIGGKQWLITMS